MLGISGLSPKILMIGLLAIVVVAGVATAVVLNDDGDNDNGGDGGNDPGYIPGGDPGDTPGNGELVVLVGDRITFDTVRTVYSNYGTYDIDSESTYTVVNEGADGILDIEFDGHGSGVVDGRHMSADEYLDMLYMTPSSGSPDRVETIDALGRSVRCNVFVDTWEGGGATYYRGVDDGIMYRMVSEGTSGKTDMNLAEATMVDRDWSERHESVSTAPLKEGDWYQFQVRLDDESGYLTNDYYEIESIGPDGTLTVRHSMFGSTYEQQRPEYFMSMFAPGLRSDLPGERVNIWNDGITPCMKYVYDYEGRTVTEYIGIESGILYWLYLDAGDIWDDTVYRFAGSNLVH